MYNTDVADIRRAILEAAYETERGVTVTSRQVAKRINIDANTALQVCRQMARERLIFCKNIDRECCFIVRLTRKGRRLL